MQTLIYAKLSSAHINTYNNFIQLLLSTFQSNDFNQFSLPLCLRKLTVSVTNSMHNKHNSIIIKTVVLLNLFDKIRLSTTTILISLKSILLSGYHSFSGGSSSSTSTTTAKSPQEGRFGRSALKWTQRSWNCRSSGGTYP